MSDLSPEGAIWRYIRLRAQHGSPRSSSPVLPEKRLFGPMCEECHDTFARPTVSDANEWVCQTCAAPWPIEVVNPLRHEMSPPGTRVNGNPVVLDRLSEMADLGIIFDRLDIWHQRVFIELYVLGGQTLQRIVVALEEAGASPEAAQETARRMKRGLSQIEVMREAQRRWPTAPFPWNRRSVSRLIRSARQTIQARLQIRGL